MDRTEEQQALIEDKSEERGDPRAEGAGEGQERLEPLFSAQAADGFRSRWDEVQIGLRPRSLGGVAA